MTRRIERHRWLTRLARDDEGMMMLVNVAAVLLLALMLAAILRVADVVQRKLAMQDAADAIALSAANFQARSMNALTATNHVIGEMLSLVVLFEAVGGERIGMALGDTLIADQELAAAQAMAQARGASTFAYETVRQPVRAGMTLLDAKRTLKQELSKVYFEQAATPPPSDARSKELDLRERAIWQEYQTLGAWEAVAISLRPVHQRLKRESLPAAKVYTDFLVRQTPVVVAQVADEIGRANLVEGSLEPGDADLPVMPDPLAKAYDLGAIPESWRRSHTSTTYCQCPEGVDKTLVTRRQIVKVTQLSRATFPWVHYHRQPLLDLLNRLPISGAKERYFHWTTARLLELCDTMQSQDDLWLYVVHRATLPDKGHERWTGDGAAADELFACLGVAYRSPPASPGGALFIVDHSAGQMTLAQSLLYNANPQRPHPHRIDLTCKRIVPIHQPEVGWDTLNWVANSAGETPYEVVAKGSLLKPMYPRIRVNWQAKLTPTSRYRFERAQRDSAWPNHLQALFSRLTSIEPTSN